MLTDKEIKKGVKDKSIMISPINEGLLNPNSYDITLHSQIGMYLPEYVSDEFITKLKVLRVTDFATFYSNLRTLQKEVVLDCKKKNKFITFEIPEEGMVFYPNTLYLTSTNELLGSKVYASKVEGKSSLGRLGLSIHQTAGFIDVGFIGTVTLEFSLILPLKLYPNQKIGQIAFYKVNDVEESYEKKKDSKYTNQKGVTESKMEENFKK